MAMDYILAPHIAVERSALLLRLSGSHVQIPGPDTTKLPFKSSYYAYRSMTFDLTKQFYANEAPYSTLQYTKVPCRTQHYATVHYSTLQYTTVY
jgi:hypothetical protein